MVEILVNDTELRQTIIEDYLKRMPDFQKIEWRFAKKKANLQVNFSSLIALYQFLLSLIVNGPKILTN
jgi:hypothetical protein